MAITRAGTLTGSDAIADPLYEQTSTTQTGDNVNVPSGPDVDELEQGLFGVRPSGPIPNATDNLPVAGYDLHPEEQAIEEADEAEDDQEEEGKEDNEAENEVRPAKRTQQKRGLNKPYVFVVPIPKPEELHELWATFERPGSKRNNWGLPRNACDAIEELWMDTYNWDSNKVRIEMDYGRLIRTCGQFKAGQNINGKTCDRCFAHGKSNCGHRYQNRCKDCTKAGMRCTYTDRRTHRTREITGTAHASHEDNKANKEAKWVIWSRTDQPFVLRRECPPRDQLVVGDRKNSTKKKDDHPSPPESWIEDDIRLNAFMQQTGIESHQNPVLFDNQREDLQDVDLDPAWVNPDIYNYQPPPSTDEEKAREAETDSRRKPRARRGKAQSSYQKGTTARRPPPQPPNLEPQYNQSPNPVPQPPLQYNPNNAIPYPQPAPASQQQTNQQFSQMQQFNPVQQFPQAPLTNTQEVPGGPGWNGNDLGSAANNQGAGGNSNLEWLTMEQKVINSLSYQIGAMDNVIRNLMDVCEWYRQMFDKHKEILKPHMECPRPFESEPWPLPFPPKVQGDWPFPPRVPGGPPYPENPTQGMANDEAIYEQDQGGNIELPNQTFFQPPAQQYPEMGSEAATYTNYQSVAQAASYPDPPTTLYDKTAQAQMPPIFSGGGQFSPTAVRQPSTQLETAAQGYSRQVGGGSSAYRMNNMPSSAFSSAAAAQVNNNDPTIGQPYQQTWQARQEQNPNLQTIQLNLNGSGHYQDPSMINPQPQQPPVLDPQITQTSSQTWQPTIRPGPPGLLIPGQQAAMTGATPSRKRMHAPTVVEAQPTSKRARMGELQRADNTRSGNSLGVVNMRADLSNWSRDSPIGPTGLQELQQRPSSYEAAGFDQEMGARLSRAAARRDIVAMNRVVELNDDEDGGVALPQATSHYDGTGNQNGSGSGDSFVYGDQPSESEGPSRQVTDYVGGEFGEANNNVNVKTGIPPRSTIPLQLSSEYAQPHTETPRSTA